MEILILTIIEIILFAYLRKTEAGVKMFALINLIAITRWGNQKTVFGFGSSNTGSIWYAFALQAIVFLYYGFGKDALLRSLKHISIALLGLGFFGLVCMYFTSNENVIGLETDFRFTLANLGGFTGAGIILLLVLENLKSGFCITAITALFVAEIADSLIFFGVAFGDMIKFNEFFIVGFLVKMTIHLLLLAPSIHFSNKTAMLKAER